MDESGNDFLAGLLEFASLPESNSNSNSTSTTPRPQPSSDSGFQCGFCLKVNYKNQSTLDSHIQACAQANNFQAKFWREAGWLRSGLEAGFQFEDGLPVVNPNRICRHCQKTFANSKEVQKHTNAARCLNVKAVQDASPVVLSGTWKCGYCGKPRCYTSEVSLDSHVKMCSPRHGYIAKFWKEAGWGPGSRFGKTLDFVEDTAITKPDRICQICYQTCKSLVGLTRHLENGQCLGEPDEMTWRRPPPPPSEAIAHLARNGVLMPRYNPDSHTPLPQTAEFMRLQEAIKTASRSAITPRTHAKPPTSKRSRVDARPSKVSAAIPPPANVSPGKSASKISPLTHQKNKSRPAEPSTSGFNSTEFDFLQMVINTAPSPAITELLITIARSESEARAIPEARVRPRQKRSRESESAPGLASRMKMDRDVG